LCGETPQPFPLEISIQIFVY